MSSPLDVIMFTPAYPPQIGGVEKHLWGLNKTLRTHHKLNIHTVVFSPTPDLPPEDSTSYAPIRYYKQRPHFFASKSRLIRLIEQHPDATLHFHDFSSLAPFLPQLKKHHALERTFMTFHGWEGLYPVPEHIKKIRQDCQKLTSGNIAIGAFIPELYQTPANTLSYGATDAPQTSTPLDLTKPSILYLGRLEPDNGIAELAHAIQNTPFSLNIFGQGSLKNTLPQSKNIIINPPTKDPEPLYSQHSVVFASGYLTILEALAHQRIVIAFANSPARTLYLETHPCAEQLFICKNSQDVAQALKHCQENPQTTRDRFQPAWKWAQEQTWDKLAQSYLKLWNKPTASRSS